MNTSELKVSKENLRQHIELKVQELELLIQSLTKEEDEYFKNNLIDYNYSLGRRRQAQSELFYLRNQILPFI